MGNKLVLIAVLAWPLLTPASAGARILPEWPVEYAVERAELIVLGTRAKEKGEYLEVVVEKVLHGEAAKKGAIVLVDRLRSFKTTWQPDLGLTGKPGIELEDRLIFLCLSRKSLYDKEAPANAYELRTTGHGTAVKIIDGHNVYGYYQLHDPSSYELLREGNSRDELLRRVNRGIVLGREWAKVIAIKNKEAREKGILAFLNDRTLPSHFCMQASVALSNPKLIVVIRDEVENVKDVPHEGGEHRRTYPDESGWTRLGSALMWVEDDGKELLPLLQRIKLSRPAYYGSAVRCAAGVCGPQAIPFLKEAIIDMVEVAEAARGLQRIGTPGKEKEDRAKQSLGKGDEM